jgi:hypothetical protein
MVAPALFTTLGRKGDLAPVVSDTSDTDVSGA